MDMIWWITAALSAVAMNLIANEFFAWGRRLSECLMRRAVRRLKPEMQERMKEEWSGHLQTIPPRAVAHRHCGGVLPRST